MITENSKTKRKITDAKELDKRKEKNRLGNERCKGTGERTAGFHKRYDRAIAIEPGMRPPKAKQRKTTREEA